MIGTGVVDATFPTQITVVGPSEAESRVHQLDRPFAIVGRSHDCDIHLDDDDVSYRHAYLQVIEGRVLCTDLCSRTGVIWDEGPRASDWLRAGRFARIGPYRLEFSGPPSAPEIAHEGAVVDPLAGSSAAQSLLPRVIIEAVHGDLPAKRWRIDRTLTLIGRSNGCALRLMSHDVSSVHCGLLLMTDGFSVIDFLGKGGTYVNNKPVRHAMLENESTITIGEYEMRVLISQPRSAAALPAKPSSEASIETASAPDNGTSANRISGTEFHKVIQLQQVGSTLVATFLGDASRFHYADVHRESNAARRVFSELHLKNVVINFDGRDIYSAVNFTTAAMLARLASDHGGRAMLCNTNERTTHAIETMHYDDVWPRVSSLDEALRAMSH